jgi:hypothetical protein
MASLLAKFRIDYSDLKVIPDITKKPRESSVSFFESLISEFTQTEGTTDGESSTQESKTCTVYFEICIWFLVEEGSKTKRSSFEFKVLTILPIIFFLSLFIVYLFIYSSLSSSCSATRIFLVSVL